jgi:hypothetical protein
MDEQIDQSLDARAVGEIFDSSRRRAAERRAIARKALRRPLLFVDGVD